MVRNGARPGGEAIAIFVAHEEPVASRIVYVNQAFEHLTGYTAEQLIGHSALLLAGARPSRDQLRAIASSNDRPYRATERKARPDGSSYDVEVCLETLGHEPGGPRHRVLMQREI
jgi:PAS domain S-box-containing protein